MTSTEIRKKIDKLRTLTTRDARFRPATWLPLWEIAYQLAVMNERNAGTGGCDLPTKPVTHMGIIYLTIVMREL